MKPARRRWTKRKGGPVPLKHLVFRPNEGEGLFIPVRDFKGRIIGGQIRSFVEEPEEELEIPTEQGKKKKKPPKYKWLRGGGSWVHVPLDFKPSEKIWITEGVLKADVTTALGWPCIGVPGIGVWRKALPLIEEWRPEICVIAYDAVKDELYEGSNEKLHADNFARELTVQRGFPD